MREYFSFIKRTVKKMLGFLKSLCRAILHSTMWMISKAHTCKIKLFTKFKVGRKIIVNTADMFFLQCDGNELNRYDMVVRYLAVENYHGKNECGFALYRKMQDARIGKGYSEIGEKNFKNLIDSYDEMGYDQNSYIIADRNLQLLDGSHRIALALYYNIEEISIISIFVKENISYTLDWFLKVGFTDQEINFIMSKGEELKAKMNRPVSCVIWAPAFKLRDEIIKDLGYFATVVSCKTYEYTPFEYENIVKAIYAIDDIEDWKIDKKIEHMKCNKYKIASISLLWEAPNFRIKKSTNLPLSVSGERTKKALRSRFLNQIEDYYFDIILHIADNHMQSEYMFNVFEPNINLSGLLDALKEYEYALTKIDVPYMPEDFPNRIPVGKDCDIVCSVKDFENIRTFLLAWSKQFLYYKVVVNERPDRIMVRLEKSGRLIYLLDCSCSIKGIPVECISYALSHYRKVTANGYYIFDEPYEALIRKVSYDYNHTKTYHYDYYLKHKTDDCEALFTSFGGRSINV